MLVGRPIGLPELGTKNSDLWVTWVQGECFWGVRLELKC